jgi:type 1 glutamine amidotransferase
MTRFLRTTLWLALLAAIGIPARGREPGEKQIAPREEANAGGAKASETPGGAAVNSPAADRPVATEPSTAAVLIVTGIDYPGHKWRLTTPVLRQHLEEDSRLQVRVVEDPAFLESPALAAYDAIVLHFMNWETPDPGPKARENLRKFVANGKGIVLVHFACGAFQEWPEFRNLAGRVWDPNLRGHDPHGTFRVDVASPKHPIMQGMESFETVDELYTCLAGDRDIDLLATATSKVDGKDYPMAFAFSYGRGRVFHSPLGHDAKAFESPMVGELFRRGCAWAAGLSPVPESRNDAAPGK